jgi:hypothetical protein
VRNIDVDIKNGHLLVRGEGMAQAPVSEGLFMRAVDAPR